MKKIKIKVTGRPGWHIECSVMSQKLLNTETLDIHAGGRDLIFPHHENEIAQAEALTGKPFAKYWLHHGLLTINGQKMAKSLGNFITIKGFLSQYRDMELLKLLFLGTHYRHPVDYTEEKMEEAKKAKQRGVEFFRKITEASQSYSSDRSKEINSLKQKFIAAMNDDFNMPEALSVIFELISLGNTCLKEGDVKLAKDVRSAIDKMCAIFGISFEEANLVLEENEEQLLKEREKARKEKNFKKADEIRKMLIDKYNIILEDTKGGTVWRKKV